MDKSQEVAGGGACSCLGVTSSLQATRCYYRSPILSRFQTRRLISPLLYNLSYNFESLQADLSEITSKYPIGT